MAVEESRSHRAEYGEQVTEVEQETCWSKAVRVSKKMVSTAFEVLREASWDGEVDGEGKMAWSRYSR